MPVKRKRLPRDRGVASGEKRDPKTHRTPSQKRGDTARRQKLPKEKVKAKQRKATTRAMIKAGRAKVGDGMDNDHVKPLSSGGSSKISNVRLKSPSKNRSHRLSGKKR